MTHDDLIRMAREAGAGVALTMSSTPRISDALFRGKALETFARLVTAAADAPWKNAVIEQLVVAHIYSSEYETTPRKALQDLLAYHADIAVDPRVSEAAAKLVEQTLAKEREAWPDLTCVIQWLEAGCDPKDAAKELRILQGKICAGRES